MTREHKRLIEVQGRRTRLRLIDRGLDLFMIGLERRGRKGPRTQSPPRSPVRVLSRLYRRLFLQRLQAAFDGGRLGFFGDLTHLHEPAAFTRHLQALRDVEWIVYAKRPFAGPQQVLDYLGHYTHRVAIANSRLLACDNGHVRFRWKDYRASGKTKVMTLDADELIRRFLLHTLPKGFRRIRHFGFLANTCRAAKLARIRTALDAPEPAPTVEQTDYRERYAILTGHRIDLCPVCAGRMIEIGLYPRQPRPPRCDTS